MPLRNLFQVIFLLECSEFSTFIDTIAMIKTALDNLEGFKILLCFLIESSTKTKAT